MSVNIETQVDPELWSAVRRSYESAGWSNAILDAIHRLSDVIRAKTGLQSDGVVLAGQALGGKSPKLRLNRLETESETSFQSGIEHLVRGLYQAFRNPRSHGKINDSQRDADAVIIFVDHLIKLIGVARTEFTLDTCVDRILEENFVPSQRYAELIVSEVPARHRLDVAVSVFQRRGSSDGKRLKFFFDSIIPKLSDAEKADLLRVISDELRSASADGDIRLVLQLLGPDYWLALDEVARLRVEHLLHKDLQDGRYDKATYRCVGGALATWSRSFFKHLTLREEFYLTLIHKLRSRNRQQQDYVFEYFFTALELLKDSPDAIFENAVISGLNSGDARFYNAMKYSPPPWLRLGHSARVQAALRDYEEKHPTIEDDEEVPF